MPYKIDDPKNIEEQRVAGQIVSPAEPDAYTLLAGGEYVAICELLAAQRDRAALAA